MGCKDSENISISTGYSPLPNRPIRPNNNLLGIIKGGEKVPLEACLRLALIEGQKENKKERR